jgi:hypothetical protein
MAQTLEELELTTAAPTGWHDRFARVMGPLVPDAITAAIICMLMLTGMALAAAHGRSGYGSRDEEALDESGRGDGHGRLHVAGAGARRRGKVYAAIAAPLRPPANLAAVRAVNAPSA